MNTAAQQPAVNATTVAFGNHVDPARVLFDAPNLSLVEVDLPEYARNGLGRVLLKVVRYSFTDIGKFGVEGLSVGADSSRGHMIYADMNPVVVGLTHTELQNACPPEIIKKLYQSHLPIELVSIGALRFAQHGDFEELLMFIRQYHQRASWIECHPVEVRFSNIEALSGDVVAFDWNRIFKI